MVNALSGTVWRGRLMSNRTRLIAGAFVAAAVAVPLYAAAVSTDSAAGHGQPAVPGMVRKQRGRQVPVLLERPARLGRNTAVSMAATAPTPVGALGRCLPGTTINQGIG